MCQLFTSARPQYCQSTILATCVRACEAESSDADRGEDGYGGGAGRLCHERPHHNFRRWRLCTCRQLGGLIPSRASDPEYGVTVVGAGENATQCRAYLQV